MNWEQLKKDGYFIRVTKGKFKNKSYTNYQMYKSDEKGNGGTTQCYLNRKAVIELEEKFNFLRVEDDKETIWLNHHDFMDFPTQTREALKIAFH